MILRKFLNYSGVYNLKRVSGSISAAINFVQGLKIQ